MATDRLFWLTLKVRPYFTCPWTGDTCPDRVGCVQKDECWRFAQDKARNLADSSLSELVIK
jgi:hypothetical protein